MCVTNSETDSLRPWRYTNLLTKQVYVLMTGIRINITLICRDTGFCFWICDTDVRWMPQAPRCCIHYYIWWIGYRV